MTLANGFDAFKKNFSPLLELDEEASALIAGLTQTVELKKGESVVEQYGECKHLFFLVEGLMASKYRTIQDEEIISGFYDRGAFFTNCRSFYNLDKSNETIFAIEPSQCVFFDREAFQGIMREIKGMPDAIMMLMTKQRIELENRIRLLQHLSTHEKYDEFTREYPALQNRVPLKYVASFLGVRQETLSRVRANG